MANLKEVRDRIGSVKTTQQITKAMKLVSASKLKRAQDRITQMRPYSEKLSGILRNLMASLEGEEISVNFNKVREPKNILIVLITSDKGLCGGFNSNLIKKTKLLLEDKYNEQFRAGNVSLLVCGKKGYDAYKNVTENINTDHQNIFSDLNFESSANISKYMMDSFLNEEYDVIECVYSQFKNAATQIYQSEQFLPIESLEAEEGDDSNMNVDYLFEPDKIELIENLVPKILNTQFYRYLLDSNASEHGARMVAMDKATENANELLNELKLKYNRERQAAITNEILEIVGGAAALDQG